MVFKNLENFCSFSTKESCFLLSDDLYEQNDKVKMGSSLGSNTFLAYSKQEWLESYLLEYEPTYCRQYIDDTFVLFKSLN